MSWLSKDRTKPTLSYNQPTSDFNLSAEMMQVAGIGFEKKMGDPSFANKFYKKWAELARNELTRYAREHLSDWYGGAKKSDSKKIPLRAKYKVRGHYAELYIWSYPTNYVFHVGKSNVPSKWIKFKKKDKVKPVLGSKGWFTPKRFKRDIHNINTNDVALDGSPKRFFTSRTSHEKTWDYKMPFVWYQTTNGGVRALQLRMQVADAVMNSPDLKALLKTAFERAVNDVR